MRERIAFFCTKIFFSLGIYIGSMLVAAAAEPAKHGNEEKIRLKGELRVRYEHERQVKPSSVARSRELVRARLGAEAKPHEDLTALVQISTGTGSAISRNVTLGDGFATKTVQFEHLYLMYAPAFLPKTKLLAGKMELPFQSPIASQLIWDNEVRPEGVALQYAPEWQDGRLALTGGHFPLRESRTAKDAGLGAIQAVATLSPASAPLSVALGASWYGFSKIDGQSVFDATGTGAGNTVSGSTYGERFKLYEAFIEPTIRWREVPVSFAYQIVKNYQAKNGQGLGWLTGLRIGRSTSAGDWQGTLTYRSLQRDAVVGAFTDSDFAGGGTDVKGFDFLLSYRISSALLAQSSYKNSLRNVSGADARHQLVQVELNLKF